MLFSKGVRKHCYKRACHARARGWGMYVRGRRAGRAYLLSKRKNESGEHAGNRSGECMGNRLGESAGGAWESKRNDWRESCESAGGEMVET